MFFEMFILFPIIILLLVAVFVWRKKKKGTSIKKMATRRGGYG